MKKIRPQAVCHPELLHYAFGYCKKCYYTLRYKQEQEKYAKNYQMEKAEIKSKRLFKAYGITLKDYNVLLEKQHNVCGICGKPPKKRMLDVDHNHKTGEVRGLLCHMCNRALGYLKVDIHPDMAYAADQYMYFNDSSYPHDKHDHA